MIFSNALFITIRIFASIHNSIHSFIGLLLRQCTNNNLLSEHKLGLVQLGGRKEKKGSTKLLTNN